MSAGNVCGFLIPAMLLLKSGYPPSGLPVLWLDGRYSCWPLMCSCTKLLLVPWPALNLLLWLGRVIAQGLLRRQP